MTFQTPTSIRTRSMPAKFGSTPFLPAPRVASLANLIGPLSSGGLAATSDARVNWEWNTRVAGVPNDYQPRASFTSWDIEDHYGDDSPTNAEQLARINNDANAAVGLAIKYLILGDEAALDGAVRVLTAYSSINTWADNNGSILNWNNKWPVFLQAAMLIRNTPAYTPALDAALRLVTSSSAHLSTAYRENNWGAWGCCFDIASAVFLGDRVRFDRSIRRWRMLFDVAVVNNIPEDEVRREASGQGNGRYGLWYSNFFLYGMTAAAEWARYAGEWLYDYKSSLDSSTFKGLYENVRYWTRHPELFPYNTSGFPLTTIRILAHDEILYALWPSEDGAWLLANYPVGSDRDTYGLHQHVLIYRHRPLYG